MGRRGWSTVRAGVVACVVALAAPAVALADADSFCGGGDEGVEDGSTRLYEIEEKLEIGELQRARRMLVAGMMRGTFRDGVRGQALGVWAEIELRLGRSRRAERLYGRAIRAQAPGDTDPLHVGLALAQLRSGRTVAALRTASRFAEAACSGATVEDPVACYGARLVLARAETTPAAREEQAERAANVRAADARLEESFAAMERLAPTERRGARTSAALAATEATEPATPTAAAAASASREAPRAAVAAR